MDYGRLLDRLDEAVESGELTEEEAREELRWAKVEYDEEWERDWR